MFISSSSLRTADEDFSLASSCGAAAAAAWLMTGIADRPTVPLISDAVLRFLLRVHEELDEEEEELVSFCRRC